MKPCHLFLWGAISLMPACTPLALAQQGSDPLNNDEIEAVREARDQPNERIKLYMKFIDDRIAAIKDLASEPNVNNRPALIRAKLEEFTRLSDELQDNLDTFDSEHADLRKALKELVPDSAKWPDILRKPAANTGYDFARKTALDAAQSANDQAKKMMDDQEKYFAVHKDERGKNGTGPS